MKAKDIIGHDILRLAFEDFGFESLYELYRNTYKCTPCGPSVGALVRSIDKQDRWYYCDELRTLPRFMEMPAKGIEVLSLQVGSIVEGLDVDCDSVVVELEDTDPDTFSKNYWAAVDTVNEEASQLWDETHGCPDCFGYGDEELHPIDPECQSCGGFGVVI